MNDMPMEIWAESIEMMHWFTSKEDGEGCACGGFLTLYHHDDKYRALEAENKRLREALEYCAKDPWMMPQEAQAQFMVARQTLDAIREKDDE